MASSAGLLLWSPKEQGYLVAWNPKKKKWEDPGGKFQPGESAADCAKRELREETGHSWQDFEIDWERPVQVLLNGKSGTYHTIFRGTAPGNVRGDFLAPAGVESSGSFRLARAVFTAAR